MLHAMDAGEKRESVWREWLRRDRVTFALALSLSLHCSLYGGFVLARKFGIVDLPLPRWVRQITELKFLMPRPPTPQERAKLPVPAKPEPEREVVLTFVDVDPRQAVEDPPPNAKFMSTHSTRAANPEPKRDTNDPNIEGKQKLLPKILEADQPRPAATPKPEEPAPPPKPQPPEPKAAPTPPLPVAPPKPPEPVAPAPPASKPQVAELRPSPQPVPAPGDLRPMKPPPEPKFTEAKSGGPQDLQPAPAAPRDKPRLLSQVRPAEQGLTIAGQRMIQDGGVRRIGDVGLDVRGSLFGAYDAALIASIQQSWFQAIGDKATPRGKVIIRFKLHPDGRVSDLKVEDSTVGEFFDYFCQRGILAPAPFPKWPADMRRQIEGDYRDVRFTFFYN